MPSRQPSYYRRTDGKGMFGSLQEAYDRLDVIIESSYDGIYITDGNAVTIRVNRAYLEISGLQEEEVMGQNMWDLEKAGVIDRSGTLIALSTRKPASLEQTFRSGRKALITSTPVFGDGDRIVMVVTNVRDMTDFYELQEKYEAAEALTQKYYSEIQFVRRQVLDSAELIAADQRMLEVLAMVDRVAAMDATVLLLGETGVGKEQIAKYIYKASPRHGERFLTVNCGAIPPNLIESELFGYDKGAFTGANKEGKLGLFELADKGTVFLDEIGELPLDMQVKLLRVLQEQQVVRVGGSEPVSINVRILAATNRPESLDKALLRPGRFDRRVPVELPDLKGREAILKVHGQNVKMSEDVDYNAIARATAGASGAELANIINEAALRAVRMGRSAVVQADLEESVETVIAGYQKKNAVISQKERRIVAYHEVGHALVAACQSHSAPVQKITIIPRTSGALGYTMQVEQGERYLMSREEALDKIATFTGGRAAEELIFHSITTGASNDIEQATKIARSMVTRFGMTDEFDMVAMETVNNQYLGGDTSLICAPDTAKRIDEQVVSIVKEQHKKALSILRENEGRLHEIAAYLLEKETITGDEFMEIFNRAEEEQVLGE